MPRYVAKKLTIWIYCNFWKFFFSSNISFSDNHVEDDENNSEDIDNQYNDSDEGPPFKSSKKKKQYRWKKNPNKLKCPANLATAEKRRCNKRRTFCKQKCKSSWFCSNPKYKKRKNDCEAKKDTQGKKIYSCGTCQVVDKCKDCKKWQSQTFAMDENKEKRTEYGCSKLCFHKDFKTRLAACKDKRCNVCGSKSKLVPRCGTLSCGMGDKPNKCK